MWYRVILGCAIAAHSGCAGCEKLIGPEVADLAIDDQGNVIAVVATHEPSSVQYEDDTYRSRARVLYRLGAGKERWERVDSSCGEAEKVCVARDGALLLRGSSVPLCGSYDGGHTWSEVSDSPTECGDITVDAGNPNHWYRFNPGRFALSRDSGQSWTEYTADSFGVNTLQAMAVDAMVPGFVMLLADRYGEAGANLLWSADSGLTWRTHTIAPIGSCEWAGEQLWTGSMPDGARRTYLVMSGEYAEKRGNQIINPQSVDCLIVLDGLPEGALLVPEGSGAPDGGVHSDTGEGEPDASIPQDASAPDAEVLLDAAPDKAKPSSGSQTLVQGAGDWFAMRLLLQVFEQNDGRITSLAVQRANPNFALVGLRPSERKGSVGGVRGTKDGSTPTMMNAGLPPPEPQPQYEPEGGGGGGGGCVGGQVYCCAGSSGCQGDVSGGPCLHFSCDEGCGSWVQCN